jgi:hypothetical protein
LRIESFDLLEEVYEQRVKTRKSAVAFIGYDFSLLDAIGHYLVDNCEESFVLRFIESVNLISK